MVYNLNGVSGKEALVGDNLIKFLESEHFPRILGCYREQSKRSKILNKIKKEKRTHIIMMINSGKFDKIKDVYRPYGPFFTSRVRNGVQLNFYAELERCLIIKKIKNITNQLSVVAAIESVAKPQAGWDPFGVKDLASSVREVASEAVRVQASLENKTQAVIDTGKTLNDTILTAIGSLMPKINNATQSFEKVANNGIGFDFGCINKLFEDPAKCVIVLAMLYIFIEYLDHHYDIPHIDYVKAIVASLAIFKCGLVVKDLFVNWLQFDSKVTPQSGWTDWLQVGVQGVLFVVFGACVDTTTLTKAITSLGALSSNATKLQEVFMAIVDWFKNLMNLVVRFFGKETYDWLQTHDMVLAKFVDKVNQLNAAFVENPMCVDLEYVQEVTKLMMEVNDYSSTVAIKSKNTPVLIAIKQIQDKLSKLQNAIASSGLTLGERCEPGIRVLASAPGVGKTYFTDFEHQRLILAYAETIEEVIDVQRNWRTEVYPWPFENKHHDLYRGQRIINYPDLFCQTDAEGQPGEPASLVYLVGDQVMSLPAADISKKQKLLVVSDVLTAATNVVMIHKSMFKSIRNPDAVIRRVNECSFYMYVTDKYALKTPDGKYDIDPSTNRVKGYEHHDYLYARIDKLKVPEGTLPPDVYKFRRLNFRTGSFMDNKIYDQEAYFAHVIKYVKDKKRAGEAKKALLKTQLEDLSRQRVAEINNPLPQGGIGSVEVDESFVPYEPPPLDDYDLLNQDAKHADREKMSYKLLEEKYMALKRRQEEAEAKENEAWLDECLAEVEAEQYDTAEEDVKVQMDHEEKVTISPIPERDIKVVPGPYDQPRFNPRHIDYDIADNWDDWCKKVIDKYPSDEDATPVSHAVSEMPAVITERMKAANSANVWAMDSKYAELADPSRRLIDELWAPTITLEQYERIRMYATDYYIELAEADKIIDARGVHEYPEREARRWFALSKMIEDMGDDWSVTSVISVIPCIRILEFASLTYEEVLSNYRSWVLEYKFKRPFVRAMYDASTYIQGLWRNIKATVYKIPSEVGKVVHSIMPKWLTNYYYSDKFQLIWDMAILSVVSTAASYVVLVAFAMLYSWLQPKRKKRKAQNQSDGEEEVEFEGLRAKEQADWSEESGVDRTITRHLDNFAALYVKVYAGGRTFTRHPCNIVFLGTTIGVMVKHVAEGIQKIRDVIGDSAGVKIELIIVPFIGNTMEKSTERTFVNDVTFEGNRELSAYDLSIIRFNQKGFRKRAKLINLIPPVACMEYMMKYKRLDGVFVERTMTRDLTFEGPEKRVKVVFDFGKRIMYDSDISHDGTTYPLSSYNYQSIQMTGKYEKFETQEGYCSSPGFMIDDRKNFCTKMGWPQAQQAWFCYLHTSIQAHIPNGVPIFREMFSQWEEELNKINIKPPAEAIKENVKFYEEVMEEELGLVKTESDDFEIVEQFERIDINHVAIGHTNITFAEPHHTAIKRSALHGIDPRTRVPVRFGVIPTPNGPVDVKEKSRVPCGANNICLNGPVVDGIMYQAMGRVMSDSSAPVNREKMDLDQCLYGDPAFSLSGMNWQSSGGFYFKVMKDYFKTDWKAKAWMLGEDQQLKPEVYRAVERLFNYFDDKLAKGERIYSLAVDNIKDELLPKEKVLEGKGRLFCVYDFVFLLLSRKHFGTFAGWIYENRIKNGLAIGVNPYSDDWDAVATKVLMNSYKCLFLDHTQFDKNQIRRIMHCILILATMYYNDHGTSSERIRELLFEEIVDSIHITMKDGKMYIYYWGQGNTSGNFFTTILNCLVNMVYIYICAIYAWLLYHGIEPNSLAAVPKNPADEALAIVDLGDDVVASVNDELMPGVNFNTIKAVGKKYLNITITDELKKGGDIPDFRELTEGSFLGRDFVLMVINGRKVYRGRLRMYSCIERVQWNKGLVDPVVEVEKVESTNLELSIYPRDVFYSYVPRYAEACFREYGIYPKYTDYEVARAAVFALPYDKYTFMDFLDSDEMYIGPDIAKVLAKLKSDEEKRNLTSGFVKDLDEVIAADAAHFSNYRVLVEEDQDQQEKPTLRRIPQSSHQVSVVTSDMAMDIETEGVVDVPRPIWL